VSVKGSGAPGESWVADGVSGVEVRLFRFNQLRMRLPYPVGIFDASS
jgi:hypothetical protein